MQFADDTALNILVWGQVIFRFANLFHSKLLFGVLRQN